MHSAREGEAPAEPRRRKVFAGHWCGRTESLLHLVPGCGLDAIEAIVTAPMANIELSEALDRLRGEVVLQGGIPSVLVCEQGCTRDEFEAYIRDVILPLKGRRGFVLGMSDNVPPNADFSRIEVVAGLLGE
jgi:uroporphyrinogen-III decarboxylase